MTHKKLHCCEIGLVVTHSSNSYIDVVLYIWQSEIMESWGLRNLFTFFLSRTNFKLDVSITPKLVKNVITNVDFSKGLGPEYIPVVILKGCESKISFIQAEIFNICLKQTCFPDCWKISSVVFVFNPLLRNVVKWSDTL